MEVENLTTGEDSPQVNVEEQTPESTEEFSVDQVEETPEVDTTTDPEFDAAYDSVWDKDINEVDLNTIEDTTVQSPFEQVDEIEDTSTNGTNNSIGAFMSEKPVLKYKGKDVPIDSADELLALAQKGFSYETEMANIKPQKQKLRIIENVPVEVLQAVADLNAGKKEALNFLKSAYGIEDTKQESNGFWDEGSNDNQTESQESYTPEVAPEDPVIDYFNEYAKVNQTGAAKVNEIYSSLDESFKAEIYKPNIFQAFVASVETGEFETVYPLAVKEKALNPAITWIQAYQMALGKSGQQQPAVTEPPAAATPPKQQEQGRHMSADSAADRVWNDDEYFKSLEAKIFGA
jgi:hypothetical protein